MPTESELRQLLESTEVPGTLDAARIIRKSKARRLPAQVAAGGTFTFAIAAVGVLGFSGILNPASTSDESRVESAEQLDLTSPESANGEVVEQFDSPRADELNLCGSPIAVLSPDPEGLHLDLELPNTAEVGTDIAGTAILTNNGDERVAGTTTASPVVTVADNGVVVWHSNGFMTMQAVMVDLGPGESLEYPAHISPVRCGPEDELGGSFRADLPPLEAGEYSVSAAIDFTPQDSADAGSPRGSEVVVGAPATIELE